MIKRILDIAFALIALVVLSPMFVVISCLIYLQMGKPILFCQSRPGYKEKTFKMYKFRTMSASDESSDVGNVASDIDRITRLGAFLRRTSLDELPEFWNVLKGDMSIVGPRPLLVEYLPLYNPLQRRRHDVRPGITGWAQVNGRNAISWEQKFLLDVWYVENSSVLLDTKIILMTVISVIGRKGVSSEGQATTTPFRGSKRE